MTASLGASADVLVLVVAQDDAVRRDLLDALAGVGIRGVGAATGTQALELQAQHQPSVLVIDDAVADGTGRELAARMKVSHPEVPVLLLTGYGSIDDTIAALGRLDEYLVKPPVAQAFLQMVSNALARHGLVTENRNQAERLQRLNAYQALYDPLTGLPNRALLDDRLNQALAACRRSGGCLAVLFLDLDGFKVVNDLFGHHVGDQLLHQIADRLARACRQSDTVARFGGDEFVVVCPDIRSSAAACRIAEHLLEEVSRPAEVEGVEHRLTASVGVAVTDAGAVEQSPDMLLRDADTAMYRAKEEGRSAWELFDDAMRGRVMERFEVERGLRAGLGGQDLNLVYQPVVDLSTGDVVAAEALLRWHRSGHGTLLPASFLAVAEESGLIVPIGRWALERAVADLADWRKAGLVDAGFQLWVNVSPHQLANPHFADLVHDVLDAYDVPAQALGLEIVEEVLRDVGATAKVLRSLRELGMSLSLDDFGAGSSNLSWLEELPITGLKIDAHFVARLEVAGDAQGRAIVQGLISLGHALGLSMVGEGVETAAQADALRTMGCELAQGFHFAYPGTAANLWATTDTAAGDPATGAAARSSPSGARAAHGAAG